jgi:voltage-gated potassium channel
MEIVVCGIQVLYYLLATWRAPSELRLARLPECGKDSEMMILNPIRFLHQLARVLGALCLVLTLLCIVFFGLAVTLYFAERGQQFPNSPHGFAESLYFSGVTALTIGYGDLVPHTVFGRCICLLLAVVGITLTGIVAAAAVKALELQIQEHNRAKPQQRALTSSREPANHHQDCVLCGDPSTTQEILG